MLKATRFTEKYNVSKTLVYTVYHNGNKYIYKIGDTLYVDEEALIKRREFYTKVWNETTENYYTLLEPLQQYQLAEILSKYTDRSKQTWNMFMQKDLFSTAFQDRSLFSYEIPGKLWEFHRMTRFIVRKLRRKGEIE